MYFIPTATFIFAFISGIAASKNTEDSMIDVWVMSGGRASLPCVPKPKLKDDQPVLVLWYRRFSSSLPIYSYDARVGDFSNGVRWWDEVALGRRGYFVPSSGPPALVLEPAHVHDQDVYTCRIDYRVSTSTSTRVNLTVVVPPGPPVVIWEGREMVGTVGPLQENQLTELTCRSVGGRPAPTLTWWSEGRELPLLYANSSLDPVTGTSVVEATLSVTAKRELQGGSLKCCALTPNHLNASEAASVPPRSVSVSLNITLSPVEVRILEPSPIVATSGTTINVVCRALGSHPPADLSWWRGIRSLEPHVTHAIQDGGNITTATLTISVTGEDDGATVTCTGVNPALSHEPLSDRRKLIVYYEPIVDLTLGKPLDAENIKEADDVYFECGIKSNPRFHRIEWYHNGQEVSQNISTGVVISKQSLVIRRVVRSQSGSYTCVVTNVQGRTVSNTFSLTVQHAPICAGPAGQERTQGAARGTVVKAKCRVEAEPSSSLIWSWVRKRTDGSEEILSPNKYAVEGLTSTLTVVPERREDYGRLLCRATNSVGRQKEPCVVNLVPAGPPDKPTNCSATTVNPDALQPALAVTCLEGFDGGLPQSFLLEAWQGGLVLANISSEYPEWVLSGMEAGKGVILNIVGHNIRGRSDPVTMEVQTSSAQHRAAPVQESAMEVPPILGAALGVLGVILVLLLVGVAIVKRSCRCPRKPVNDKTLASSSTEGLDPDVVQSIKRLDVVPCLQEEHNNEEIDPMFTFSEHTYPPGDTRETEESHEITEEGIGNKALLPGKVQTHSSELPRQRRQYGISTQRLNLPHDQSEDSGVSESESDNELKIPRAAGSSSPAPCSKGESDRPYIAVPRDGAVRSSEKKSSGGDSGCRHSSSLTDISTTCSSTKDLYGTPEGGHHTSRISHEGIPLAIPLREMPLDPTSREVHLGTSKRGSPTRGYNASPVEVICLAVSPTEVLSPVANKGQIPSKTKNVYPLMQELQESEQPKRDPARIPSLDSSEIGVPVTLYKADTGKLLFLPRKPDYEGIGVQLTTTPVYAISTLPKTTGKRGKASLETRTKENDSNKKLPTSKDLDTKTVGQRDYIPPVHPDVCRRESSV